MKVLSVRQPWAWAIIHGGKNVENRDWPTKFRGRLAIHAGKQFDIGKHDWQDYLQGEYGEPWASMAQTYSKELLAYRSVVRFGAIIGTVEVYDCVPDTQCDSPWKADGYQFYCWLLRHPVALREPIPMAGRLGLWDIPDSLLEEQRPLRGDKK